MNLPPFPYLSVITFAPTVAMVIIMLMSRENITGIRLVATLAAALSFILSIIVWIGYDQSTGGVQFHEIVPIIPQFGINYHVGVDGIGIPMMMLNSIVGLAGMLVSWRTIVDRQKEFFALYGLLITSVTGVFVSMDLFLLFVFYELAVLPMYLLIAVWGTPRNWRLFWYPPGRDPDRVKTKEYAAMKLTLFLVFGSALLLVGIIAMFLTAQAQGKPTFDIFTLATVRFDANFQRIFFLPIFLGFAVLAGLWPFHIWSPDGYVAAPAPVSMIHAGVLKKLGAFGILRVAIFLLPEGARMFLPGIAILTLISAIYAALIALQQRDMKYVIGYSSVSHMGLVLLGLASMTQIGMTGAVMQMFSHGVTAAIFFAIIGFLYHQTHTRDMREYGGLVRTLPFLGTSFIIAAMASLGLPSLSGFVSELLIFIGAWQFSPLYAFIGMTTVVFTAIYLLRSVQFIFYGSLNPSRIGLRDMRGFVERAPILMMIFILFLFGLAPFIITNMINSSIGMTVARLAGEAGQAFVR